MRSNNRLFRTALFCLLCFTLQPWCLAESENSPWAALPEEAVAALRIPNGKDFIKALKGTKMGEVLLSEKRKAGVLEILESDESGEWEGFQKQLLEYDLTTEDLLALLAGETGYAVILTQTEAAPTVTGLGWLEPGEELANKMFKVIAKAIDEQDDENAIIRADITLGEQAVMQLLLPSLETEYTEEFDYDYDADAEKGAWQKSYQKYLDSAVETVVYSPLLLTVVGDRMLIVHDFVAVDEDTASTSAEQLGTILSQWLETQAASSGTFVSRLTQEAGAARVMANEGLPLFELLGDPAYLVKLIRETKNGKENAEKMIAMLGLEDIGAIAIRSTIKNAIWKTQMSLAIPAPRQGLARLLDQEALAIEPPQWIPASAVRYWQLSFDLGEAYEIIKEEVTLAFPEQAAGGFSMAEVQVENFAKVSLPELLSSFGNRHTSISYGMDKAAANSETEDDGSDALSERMAFVWQIEDEDLWTNLFKALAPMAGMLPGAESAEEQGFNGFRVKNEQKEGGLFLGKGQLVLGIGTGVVETTLSSLNNPPAGSDALRGSELLIRAGELMDLKPALAVEITDGDRYMGMIVNVLRQQMETYDTLLSSINDDNEKEDNLFFDLIRVVLPTDAEIKGMVGVIVNRAEVNEEGLFYEGVQEMPSP